MCEATTIGLATLIIGAASSVASGMQAQQQAQAQADYQAAQANEYARVNALNNKAAVKEYVEQSAAERIGQMQEQEAATQAAQEVQKDALEKKGTMMASTNAAGMALDWLMADYDRAEAGSRDNIRHQYEMASANSTITIDSYKDKAQNRINSQQNFITMPSSYSPGMNMLGTALGIGSAAVGAYDKYTKYNDLKLKNTPAATSPPFSPYTAASRMATNR